MNQGSLVSTFHTSDSVTCLDVISHKWQAVCGTESGSVYKFVILRLSIHFFAFSYFRNLSRSVLLMCRSRWLIGSDTPLGHHPGLDTGPITAIKCLDRLHPSYIAVSSMVGYIHLLDFQELTLLASFCLGESVTSIDCNLNGTIVAYSSISGFIGLVGVSSKLEDNILFESGPYLFKPNDKITQFGNFSSDSVC